MTSFFTSIRCFRLASQRTLQRNCFTTRSNIHRIHLQTRHTRCWRSSALNDGQSSPQASPKLLAVFSVLAASGAITGTLLDGIHSRTGLQVYDVAPLVIGGLKTSLAVPPLLAAFYCVLGSLHPLLDNLAQDDATETARRRARDFGWVALGAGLLAAELHLSAVLYSGGAPTHQILLVLSAVAASNWFLLDGTRQGLLLATVCALGAPVSEVLLNNLFGLWHYPSGDILDGAFVSWVPLCYFFYTPALGNLARYVWNRSMEQGTT